MDSLQISLLPAVNTIVIKKSPESNIFRSTSDSIIIHTDVLYHIIRAMILNGILDPKLFEEILEEI